MANTKIPVELSSTPGIVDGSNATAITINSNEQVGLGTTPPTDTHATWSQFFIGQKGSLISEKSGTGGIYGTILSDNLYIDSDTGSPANIVTNESSAYIQEAGSHKFYSQASGSAGAAVTLSEKMQIDSSGNAIFTKSGGAYLQLKDASAVRGAINVQTSDGLVFTTGSSFAERMRINDVGDVLIGGTQEYNTLNGRGNLVVGSGSGNEGITIVTGTSNTGGISFADGTSGDAAYRGQIEYLHSADAMSFVTAATERMRINDAGITTFGTTGASPVFNNQSGVSIGDNNGATVVGVGQFSASGAVAGRFNRTNEDGVIIAIHQAGTQEGTISVSGSTVSYNGFSGNHETSGIASDTPIGTVCSTIDELDTYLSGSKEGQTRADHAKIKVSDAVGDTRVYGVLTNFDKEIDNKPIVASVGIGSILVTGSCVGGDLLESNGDGTAKVQDDDIIKSKTIGKVTIGNSTSSVKLVSCVLYCG